VFGLNLMRGTRWHHKLNNLWKPLSSPTRWYSSCLAHFSILSCLPHTGYENCKIPGMELLSSFVRWKSPPLFLSLGMLSLKTTFLTILSSPMSPHNWKNQSLLSQQNMICNLVHCTVQNVRQYYLVSNLGGLGTCKDIIITSVQIELSITVAFMCR
jgi:hypothetical protein